VGRADAHVRRRVFVSDRQWLFFTNASVELPYQSVATQLRLYYKDTSTTNNGILRLARYDDGNAYTYVVTATTTGSAGWGTVTVNFNHFVDYVNYSYTILWAPIVASSSMQLCGYRLAYVPPVGLVGLLPSILYNAQP
jgi:hypothetical protein